MDGRLPAACNVLADVLAARDGDAIRLDPSRFFVIEWAYDPFEQPRVEAED